MSIKKRTLNTTIGEDLPVTEDITTTRGSEILKLAGLAVVGGQVLKSGVGVLKQGIKIV